MRTPPADLRLYYLQRPAPQFYHVTGRVNSYFPSLETLFPSLTTQNTGSPSIASQEMAIDVSDGTSLVENIQTHERRRVPTWIRTMHLVEPLAVLSGEYAVPPDGALPTFRTAWQKALRKLNDPFNEAYTDAVFACMASRLVETGRSPHFCRFYGTYNARVPTYSYNVSDDMGDIEGENWYRDGLASGAFRIVASDPWDPDVTAEITRPWEDVRPRLFGSEGETASEEGNSDEESTETESSSSGSEIDEIEETDDIEVSGSAVLSRPQIQLARLNSPQTPSHSSHSSGSDDDIDYKLIVKDFPVQLTVLERCDGTLDDLMEDEIADDATADMRETKEERWTAWMFQVVAALTTAQHHFDFIHNDLHTNNVMWCGTGETHLYYHVMGAAGGDRFYRVPTFGRIMKIIDFGRATFKPPILAATNRTWFPDAYAPDADAGGQYNCGPYYEHGRPKVTPNKSFDLCRLAVAMLEAMWPTPIPALEPQKVMTREPGRVQHETTSPLWNLLWLWLTDKNGKNILYTPDGSERYPRFDLYCAIAKDAQNSVPAQQLTLPLFDAAFRCRRKDIPTEAIIYKLTAVHK